MTLIKSWVNKTTQHPNGVCEAACNLWLELIKSNGLTNANNLKPTDCDALQAKIERGQYTTAIDLEPRLNTHSPQTSNYDGFNAVQISSIKDLETAISPMGSGYFKFGSLSQNGKNGHAVAIYRDVNNFYFFDPNHGIYKYGTNQQAINQLATDFMNLNSQFNEKPLTSGHL